MVRCQWQTGKVTYMLYIALFSIWKLETGETSSCNTSMKAFRHIHQTQGFMISQAHCKNRLSKNMDSLAFELMAQDASGKLINGMMLHGGNQSQCVV